MPGNFERAGMVSMKDGKEIFVVGGFASGGGVQQTAVFKNGD